jgi:hypothetical protein
MFARLFTNNTSAAISYSEIAKVISGQITDASLLTAFDSSTSVIVSNQPSNWQEYTGVSQAGSIASNGLMWFRQRNKKGAWKYAGVYVNSTMNSHKCLFRHFEGDNPTVATTYAGTHTNGSEAYGAGKEITIAAGIGYLIIASRLTSNQYFTEINMWLEHEDVNYLSGLPNQLFYRHYSTGTSYATDATTDFAYSTGVVEYKPGAGGFQISNGGMAAPTTTVSTLRPSYYTSVPNVLDNSQVIVSYPKVQLYIVSDEQGILDCSVLTNVWGTNAFSDYATSVVLDGYTYYLLRANASLSYLVPAN